jgi:hypothetical protein
MAAFVAELACMWQYISTLRTLHFQPAAALNAEI